jgi:endonuclease-3
MRTLARAIEEHDLPAVEKIADARQAFHVLIGTLLSARTQDATTAAASERLFKRAPTPQRMAALPVPEIEELIYPVSFYRNKARHVKETCRMLIDRFKGSLSSINIKNNFSRIISQVQYTICFSG